MTGYDINSGYCLGYTPAKAKNMPLNLFQEDFQTPFGFCPSPVTLCQVALRCGWNKLEIVRVREHFQGFQITKNIHKKLAHTKMRDGVENIELMCLQPCPGPCWGTSSRGRDPISLIPHVDPKGSSIETVDYGHKHC